MTNYHQWGIRLLNWAILVRLLSACSVPETNQKTTPLPPSILFILADDLGYHDLGITGSAYYETPYINSIARQSMVFTNGYATCQVCSPSRASIMSGKFPARHGITDYIGAPTDTAWRRQGRFTQLLPPDYLRQLPHAYTVLPEALKEIGLPNLLCGQVAPRRRGVRPYRPRLRHQRRGLGVGVPPGGLLFALRQPPAHGRSPR